MALDANTTQQLRDAFAELRAAHDALALRAQATEAQIATMLVNYQLVTDKIAELEVNKASERVVDTRVLGKPGNFNGAHEHWRDWSFAFLRFVGATSGELLKFILEAGLSDMPMLVATLTATQKAHSHQT